MYVRGRECLGHFPRVAVILWSASTCMQLTWYSAAHGCSALAGTSCWCLAASQLTHFGFLLIFVYLAKYRSKVYFKIRREGRQKYSMNMWLLVLSLCVRYAVAAPAADRVVKLPDYGTPPTPQYSGFLKAVVYSLMNQDIVTELFHFHRIS